MIINSNSLTLIDTTDTKKINVHISSNHPNVQIYDVNKGTYTPSWVDSATTDPLTLNATVYADSLEVTDLATIKWFKDNTNGQHIETGSQLIISDNVLDDATSIVEYICQATYNEVDYENKITFTLITTGKNGLDGQNGKDGQDGKDGTSVNIKGTAYSKTTPITGSTITLFSDANTNNPINSDASAKIGDAYLVEGYLCVYNPEGNNFICTGKIQGAKGEKGDSSYLFVRYADDQYGTNMSVSSTGKTYVGFYRSSVDVAPTNPSLITWTKFVGTSASLVSITPSSLYFKSTEGKNGTFTPEHIYLYPRFQNVTFDKWQYSTDGGITWNNASGANGLTISTYNSVANTLRINRTSTLYTDTITSISFRCLSSNSAIYDTVSVIKIYDVVDLKIGGRNLARFTDSTNWINYRSATLSFSDGTRSKRVRAICNTTDIATDSVFGIQQSVQSRLMKLKSGQEYTLSFLIRGNIPNLNYTYLMNEGSANQNIQGIDAKSISETDFTKITKTFVANDYANLSTGSYLMISSIGPTDTSLWFEIEEVQLEAGQIVTDWMPSPEDILDSAANVNVMLSNEAHFFEADSKGIPTATNIVLDVIGYKGSIQSATKVGTISGLPSAGMTATVSNNETINTKITIAATTALTSSIADYGTLTIPITVNGHTINKVFSWSKAKAGATGATGVGIKSTTVSYGVSDSASTKPADSAWQSTIPTVAEGKYLWTRTIIDYTNNTDTVTYTYAKQGVKGDTGSSGTSVTVLNIQYQAGASATTAPTGNWSNSVVSVTEGNYLWTKTTFSDGKIAYGVAKQGISGRGISKITEYYLATTASSGVTTSTSGWTTTIQSVTSTNKYLWNYEIVTYTDGATSPTTPVIIGVFGNTGATGKGISSVAERYLATASSSGVTTSTTGWTPEVQTLTATKKYLWNYEIITYTDGTTSTVNPIIIGVYGDKGDKGDVGRGVSSIVEQYYQSTSATSQTGGSWSTTVPTWADGKYIWTRSVITYTDSTTSTTSPICITGQKGGTGVGVSSVDVWYYQSSSATSLSGGSWTTTAPTWVDGKYMWTKTITTYTNNTTDETNAVCITGQKGSTGVGVKSVTEYYLATASSSGVTTSTSGWTTTIQTITADKKYLWNYEVITYTNDTTSSTSPIIIGVFGNTGSTGAAGKGIKSVTEYYLATASSSSITTSTTGWTTAMQALTSTKKYLWNYELITYTDNTTSTVNPVIIGVYGDQGVAAVSFQVYAPNGYLLTKELESLTLQTFAYEGSTAITSGATYQWSQLIDEVWTAIDGATSTTYTVTQADVLKAKSYRCVMTYKNQTYTSTVTVQDKTDIYNSIMCISSNATNNDCYWVLYTLVYSDTEEVDPLLGPISINAPTSPVSGDYWYAVDATNASVQLKKYNGTTWVNSTDSQSLSYYWDIVNDGSTKVPFGDSTKVQVVSCHDFTATATLVCEVSNAEDGLLTQSSLSLTDASDPIVSATEPTGMVDGQIWIKPNDNGTYFMSIWDATKNVWIANDMDKRTKVYSSRPSSYNVGDLWITASDTDHGSYLGGTLLQTDTTSATYNASHWSPTLKYDQDLDKIKETLNDLSEYVNITSEGLKIGAQNASGEISPFTSLFTSTELSFYQNSDKLLTLANNQLTAPRIVVEDNLEVHKTISLGNLKLTIEDNGSFSFAVTK